MALEWLKTRPRRHRPQGLPRKRRRPPLPASLYGGGGGGQPPAFPAAALVRRRRKGQRPGPQKHPRRRWLRASVIGWFDYLVQMDATASVLEALGGTGLAAEVGTGTAAVVESLSATALVGKN